MFHSIYINLCNINLLEFLVLNLFKFIFGSSVSDCSFEIWDRQTDRQTDRQVLVLVLIYFQLVDTIVIVSVNTIIK